MTATHNPSTDNDQLRQIFADADNRADYMEASIGLTIDRLRQVDAQAVAQVADLIEAAGRAGKSIYVIGNGGSAAVASHFVNDMGVNSWVQGQPGYRVFCLADNVASVTAVANDVSYEDIFRRQLECDMQEGDVVISLSVSGNSENLVRAATYAQENGATTVAMCGFDGGRLRAVSDVLIHVPSSKDEYGPIEDMFSVVFHALSSYLSMARGRFLAH